MSQGAWSIMDLAKLQLNAFSGKCSKALSDPLPAAPPPPPPHTQTIRLCLSLTLHPLPATPAEYETSSEVSLTAWTCHQVERDNGGTTRPCPGEGI